MITRNAFLKWIGGAATTLAIAPVLGCGDDGGKPGPDAPPMIDAPKGCAATNATIMIATNHPHGMHTVVVPKEDVAAAVDKTYSIMGAASHDHMITVTAAQFTMLKAGGSITVTSTATDHSHDVTVTC